MLAKRFFYVCVGILLLALTYHLGAESATAQAEKQSLEVRVTDLERRVTALEKNNLGGVGQASAAAPTPGAVSRPPASSGQKRECTVHVTRTGTRYHRQNCSSLQSSSIPASLDEAIKKGYTPCQRCGGSECK